MNGGRPQLDGARQGAMAIRSNSIVRPRRYGERLTGRDLMPVSLSIGLHALAVAAIVWLPRPPVYFEPEIIDVELVAPEPAAPPPQASAQSEPPAEVVETPPADEPPPPIVVEQEPPPEEAPVVAEVVRPQVVQQPSQPAQRTPPRRPTPVAPRTEPARDEPRNTQPANPQPPKQTAAGPVARATDRVVAEYIARLRKMIDDRKQYPPQSLRRNEEGTVVLRVTIASNGTMSNVAVVTKITSRLAAAATEAVRAAAPFPPLPPELGNSVGSFDIPINFKIQ